MEFLTGSPFSTPVGQRIEYATSSTLQSEDWGLNMEICDIINETEDGPRDAVRAIRKRIVGNKDFREVMLALTVLEACVKNCGHRFHLLVSTREFVEGVLVRAILPKNDPPLAVHDRVLSIIQAWADAFRSSPDLTGVVFVYEDLRRKGLEFPMMEVDCCSPIHTPNKRIPDQVSPGAVKSPSSPVKSPEQTPQRDAQGSIMLSPSQVKKLRADLEVVRGNLRVMSDIMTQMERGNIKQSDAEQLRQLYSACKVRQERVLQLIPRVSEEKLVEHLLITNDHINSTFTQYQSFERFLKSQASEESCPTYADLIDLGPAPEPHQAPPTHPPVNQTLGSLTNQMEALSTRQDGPRTLNTPQSRESAESRSVLKELAAAHAHTHDSTADESADSAPLGSSPQIHWMMEKGMIPLNQSGVMDDIERWLDIDEDDNSEGVTSEEFDRFLAERARAAERLPSVKSSSDDPEHSL